MNKKSFILCLAMMILPLLASAHSFEAEGIYYGITSSTDRTVGVTFKGNSYNSYSGEYSGSITLPATVTHNGVAYSVTSIGNDAFYGCSSLTDITIPEGVTSIGGSAFSGCSSLTAITIPESVTSIGKRAFSGCSSLTAINIPENSQLTSIGNYAFYNCGSLTDITIPEGVTSIGECAFYDCSSLTAISISENSQLTSIGSFAFYDCSSLTSINIPEGVTSFGDEAFNYCSSLTSITIPENVTRIGYKAFSECRSLHSVVIGGGVLTIDSHAFIGAPLEKVIWLTNTPPSGYSSAKGKINYVANNKYSSLSNTKVYPYISSSFEVDGVIYVPNPTNMTCDVIDCRYDSNITELKIDNTVTYKGKQLKVCEVMPYAFYKNEHMESIVIYNDGNIGVNAFYDCKNLKTFEVGRDIESIGDNAFYGCSSIENFTCYAKQPPVCGSAAIDDIDKWECTLNVPEKAVERYKAADQWESFFFTEGFEVKPNIATFVIDGECYATVEVEYGEEITLPATPEKEGHTFAGWTDMPIIMPSNDIVVHGEFAKNKYKVEFIIDGKVYHSDEILYGDAIELIEEPTKEGYTFSGWSKAPETMPAEDVTISGTFTINKYLVTFKIGDEVIASDSIEYGATIVAPEAPAKEGYTFNGWGEVDATVPAHDVTYEGSYSVNSYTLTYMVDGEKYHQESIKYGTAIEAIKEPTKEGYTFSGWSEMPETMPAEDVTIEGTFIVNKYLVTFKIDDEVFASDSIEYGATIVAPEAPAKEGYIFNGWGEVDATVPAHDVTYEGSYSVNSYILTYIVDGEKYHQESIKYGTATEAIKEPTKEGYTFSGWSEVPETMPANDVTVTGTFTPLKTVYLTILQADNGCLKLKLLEGASCTFVIEAAEGWKINTVTYNGEDVTSQLTEDNTFSTPELTDDATLNISYEQELPNDVESTRANAIKVRGMGNTIIVSGTTEGETITLYTTDGTMVANQQGEADENLFTVETNKVYIVKIADKVVKIGM